MVERVPIMIRYPTAISSRSKKLEASEVRGDAHEWLRTYLTCRTQRVVVDGRASQEVPVLSGVPQGTVLWPLMFLTYINDINRDISGTIKLFANDALLFQQIRSDADCVSLQKDLDNLNSWARRWRMQLNASKCRVLQVTKKEVYYHSWIFPRPRKTKCST